MFSKDFYRKLRDDFDRGESVGGEPVLIGFLREEKERDIRIMGRQTCLRLTRAEDPDTLRECLTEVLNIIEQKPAIFKGRPEMEGRVRILLGLENGAPLKKAIEKKKEEIDGFSVKQDMDGLNSQKGFFIEAGKLLAALTGRENARRENPYISLRREYLDNKLGDRTRDDVLKKCRSIYTTKYRVADKKIRDVLRGKAEPADDDMLEEAVEMLSESILREEARAFLYDAGFPLPDREIPDSEERDPTRRGKSGSEKEKSIARKKDRVMNLIDYCSVRGLFDEKDTRTGGNADIHSAEFMQATDRLWRAMRKEEDYTAALVPLYIDAGSGAGICIIGREWADIPRGFGNYSCYFAVMNPDLMDEPADPEEAADLRNENAVSMQYKVTVCKDAAAAVYEYERMNESYFDFYRQLNGISLMDGLDQAYRRYFDHAERGTVYEEEPDIDVRRKEMEKERKAYRESYEISSLNRHPRK